jgi:DNA-binding response OmpR family regulator
MATIVFCEDDPTIQKLIGIAMRSTPHRVFIAEDGEQGLAMIRRERPDLVCTDLSMPGLDGFQLMEALKEADEFADMPVILLTASAQRSTLDEGMRRGAVAVLVKPFSTAALRAQVERVLAGEGAVEHATPTAATTPTARTTTAVTSAAEK